MTLHIHFEGSTIVTTLSARSLSLGLALGAFGGAVLALSHVYFTPGKYVLIPYAVVELGLVVGIRAERLTRFSERFVTALLAFMLATLVLYVTVVIQADASLGWGHAWRLALLAIIGTGVSLPTAVMARAPQGAIS